MIPSMISTLLPSGHSISSQNRTRSSQFWSGSWLTVSALSRVAGGRCRPPAPSEPDVRLFTASGSSGPLESRGSVILLGPSVVAGVPGERSAVISAASRPRAFGVSARSWSIPAVRRPVLCCVTRFTLTSVFEWERSMSFCKFRTFFRSPSCAAVKMRCLSRLTDASALAQSMLCQVWAWSSGPFAVVGGIAATAATATPSFGIQLALRFGSLRSSSSRAYLIRVGSLSGRGTASCPTSYGTRLRSPRPFPLGFRPVGVRFSDHPVPLEDWSFVASGLPGSLPDSNGVSTFRSHKMRPGWAPS